MTTMYGLIIVYMIFVAAVVFFLSRELFGFVKLMEAEIDSHSQLILRQGAMIEMLNKHLKEGIYAEWKLSGDEERVPFHAVCERTEHGVCVHEQKA